MPKVTDLDPWERQPRETDVAFQAFVVYRDLPDRRSCAKAGKLLGKSSKLMEDWSAQHHWVDRVAAWDREQDRVARKATLDEIAQMHRRHANLAVTMLNRAAARLVGSDDPISPVTALDTSKLTATEVARLAEVGARLERQARGEPDKIELDVGVSEEAKSAVDQLLEVLDRMGENLTAPTFTPFQGAGDSEPTGPILGPDRGGADDA